MKRSNETLRRSSISLNRPALRAASSATGRPSLCRGLHHLLAVLVGAGQEEHVLAVEPLKARQRIGRDRLIGVADMRHAVRIGDRGRDVEDVAARRRVPAVRRRAGFACGGDGCGFGDRRLLRSTAAACFGVDTAGFFVPAFFAAFLAAFLAALLRGFLRCFLGGLFCSFLRRLLRFLRRRACFFAARFFAVDFLATRARGALLAFLPFLLGVFFLRVATTNSFISSN